MVTLKKMICKQALTAFFEGQEIFYTKMPQNMEICKIGLDVW